MRFRPTALLLFTILVSGHLNAQEREQITTRSGDKFSRLDEVYYVLKADKTVKDGSYQLLRNGKVLVSGLYTHGQKDSVWKFYGRTGVVLSKKWYKAGQRTGVWEFVNFKGEPEWSYDFSTNRASVQRPAPVFQDTAIFYYRSESNTWVRDQVDQPLVVLLGSAEWLDFLNRTLRYPDEAVNKNQQGEVVVGVTIDEKGSITNYELIKTAYPSLDQEALRIIQLYPFEFVPAEKDGKKIKARFDVPIRFRLEQG